MVPVIISMCDLWVSCGHLFVVCLPARDISEIAVLSDSYVRVFVSSSFQMTEMKSYSSSLLVTTTRCVNPSSVLYAEGVFEVAVLVEGCPRVSVL